MKTIKSLTEAEISELPKLPKDWKWVSHSEISIINPPKPTGDESLEISFLPMPAVEEETGRYSLSETRKLGEVRKGYTGFIEGDVIFAKITPCMENGKVALLEKLVNGIGFGSTEFHVSRPTSSVSGKYLFHYLVQQMFRKEAKRSMTGSAGQLRVSTNYFAEQPFPLAPLPEQRAIVSKIELLFSELDNGISNLKLAQEQLKVYRQAVLKKAFEGELTKKWREKQTDLPDAKDLLEKIRKEREKVGKTGKKVKPLKPLTEVGLDELSKLPEKWNWVRIGDVSNCLDSQRIPVNKSDRMKRAGNVPYYGANGQVGWIDDYLFDEILVLVVEDETFTGREKPFSYIIKGKSWVNNHAHILQATSGLNIDFLNYQLSYYPFTPLTTGTTGRKKLTQLALINAPFKICSIPEQQAIVQEIETRLSVCDKIEQDIKENLEKAEALRQSILKKAFEGKLLNEKELAEVRGAEDWEPAEVLLERIKAEKGENGKKEKQATKRLKSIIQDDKELIQQATLQAFEQTDK